MRDEMKEGGSVTCKGSIMISRLPLLFSRGRPTSVDRLKEDALVDFVRFMLRCALGVDESGLKSVKRPRWWLRTIPYFNFNASQEVKKGHSGRLRELIVSCYEMSESGYLVDLGSKLAEFFEKGRLQLMNNFDGTISLCERESNRLVVSCRSENVNYDQVNPTASPRRHLLPRLLSSSSAGTVDMVQPPPCDIFLCDGCSSEFDSIADAKAHEKLCAAAAAVASWKDDDNDDAESVHSEPDCPDETQFLSYMGLVPSMGSGKQVYVSPVKQHQSGRQQPRRGPQRKRMSIRSSLCQMDLSSPLGKRILPLQPDGLQECDQAIGIYERHCRNSGKFSSSYPKVLVTWRPQRSKKKVQDLWHHTYSFSRAQRMSRLQTIRTGLTARSRHLLQRMLPCSVPLIRLTDAEIREALTIHHRRSAPSTTAQLCWRLSASKGAVGYTLAGVKGSLWRPGNGSVSSSSNQRSVFVTPRPAIMTVPAKPIGKEVTTAGSTFIDLCSSSDNEEDDDAPVIVMETVRRSASTVQQSLMRRTTVNGAHGSRHMPANVAGTSDSTVSQRLPLVRITNGGTAKVVKGEHVSVPSVRHPVSAETGVQGFRSCSRGASSRIGQGSAVDAVDRDASAYVHGGQGDREYVGWMTERVKVGGGPSGNESQTKNACSHWQESGGVLINGRKNDPSSAVRTSTLFLQGVANSYWPRVLLKRVDEAKSSIASSSRSDVKFRNTLSGDAGKLNIHSMSTPEVVCPVSTPGTTVKDGEPTSRTAQHTQPLVVLHRLTTRPQYLYSSGLSTLKTENNVGSTFKGEANSLSRKSDDIRSAQRRERRLARRITLAMCRMYGIQNVSHTSVQVLPTILTPTGRTPMAIRSDGQEGGSAGIQSTVTCPGGESCPHLFRTKTITDSGTVSGFYRRASKFSHEKGCAVFLDAVNMMETNNNCRLSDTVHAATTNGNDNQTCCIDWNQLLNRTAASKRLSQAQSSLSSDRRASCRREMERLLSDECKEIRQCDDFSSLLNRPQRSMRRPLMSGTGAPKKSSQAQSLLSSGRRAPCRREMERLLSDECKEIRQCDDFSSLLNRPQRSMRRPLMSGTGAPKKSNQAQRTLSSDRFASCRREMERLLSDECKEIRQCDDFSSLLNRPQRSMRQRLPGIDRTLTDSDGIDIKWLHYDECKQIRDSKFSALLKHPYRTTRRHTSTPTGLQRQSATTIKPRIKKIKRPGAASKRHSM